MLKMQRILPSRIHRHTWYLPLNTVCKMIVKIIGFDFALEADGVWEGEFWVWRFGNVAEIGGGEGGVGEGEII